MNWTEFKDLAYKMGLSVDEGVHKELCVYHGFLLDWSERVRLISRGDRTRIWERHFDDSLLGYSHLPDKGSVLDLGSGGGLPGLPLAMLRKDLRFTLLEPARMKSLFLKHVVSEVGLDHIQVVQERAERFGNQDFDVVLARGVAPLETLWELSVSLLAPGASLVAYKGPDDPPSIHEAGVVISTTHLVLNPATNRERALMIATRARST